MGKVARRLNAFLSCRVLLLAFACAACGGRAVPATESPDTLVKTEADAPQSSQDVDIKDTAADVVDGVTSDVTEEVAAPPVVTTLVIDAAPGLSLPPGHLHVRLIHHLQPVNQPTPYDDVLFDGLLDLPATVTTVVPDGTWWPVAAWMDANTKPLASNLSCDKSQVFTVNATHSAPGKITLILNTAAPQQCNEAADPGFLGELSNYIVPFSDVGVTHLLEGVPWNGSWWMAANADGIGRVDVPAGSAAVEKWKPLVGQGTCRHVVRLGNRMFCSQRNAAVTWTDFDPVSKKPTAEGEFVLPGNVHAEGMLARDGVVYASLHENGLGVLPVTPPGPPVVLTHPKLVDTWHVAGLANDNLVVANGAAGIAIVQVKNGALSILASLPLPGTSAHLAVEGNTVAVGAVAGGLHLVDVSQPTAPVLLGTLPAGPWPVFGVELLNGVAYAAASRTVLAVPVPAKPIGFLSASAAAPTDQFMTLDVRAMDGVLVTAEYALIRSLSRTGNLPQGLPIALPEAHQWAAVVEKGQSAQYTIWVWNPGSAPLHLTQFEVRQALPKGASGGPMVPFTGPTELTVAPRQSAKFVLSVPKTAPTIQNIVARIHTNDPFRPFVSVDLNESPSLNTGQALPELKYKDASGKLVDVVAYLKGKPALLIVSAESCPVAMEREAGVLNEYAATIASGKLGALVLNPWDLPQTWEVGTFPIPLVEVFSAMTTNDNTQHSSVSDEKLALPSFGFAPQLPHLYVLDASGKITYAYEGYQPLPLQQAVADVLGP